MEQKTAIWFGVLSTVISAILLCLVLIFARDARAALRENGELKRELAQAVGEAADSRNAYDSMYQDYLTAQGSLAGSEEERKGLLIEKTQLTDQNNALNTELEETRAELDALRKANNEYAARAAEAQDNLAGYAEQYDSLQQYVVSLENILSSYAEDPGAEERLSVISDLQTRLAESETENDALRKQNTSLEDTLTEVEQAYAGASALLREKGMDNESDALALEELRGEYAALQAELTQAQTDLAGQNVLLAEERQEAQEVRAELLHAQAQCAALAEERERREAEAAAYEENAKMMRGEIAALQDELSEAQQYAAGRDALLSEAAAQVALLQAGEAELEGKINDIIAEKSALEARLTELKAENGRLAQASAIPVGPEGTEAPEADSEGQERAAGAQSTRVPDLSNAGTRPAVN